MLTWRLHVNTVEVVVISVSELLETAVRIIEKRKKFVLAKKSCLNY